MCRPLRRSLALVLGVALAVGVGRGLVTAHALLARSDPPANAVLPTPPAAVTLWFTEPIAPTDSWAHLFDATGRPVTTPPSHPGPSPATLVLPLPADLSPGTYTVQWVTVSTLDGHQTGGLVAFTVGSVPVVPAAPPPLPSGPPTWLAALARGMRAIGVTGLLGMLVCWHSVSRLVMMATPAMVTQLARRVRRMAQLSWGLALVGTVLVVLVQAAAIGGQLGVAALWAALAGTRAGWLLGLELGALLLAGSGLWIQREGIALAGTGLAALAQAGMSHGAAQPAGAGAALLADVVHLGAAGCWVGGLLVTLLVLVTLRAPADRTVVVAVVRRNSAVFLASVVAVGLTGLYASWLEVGAPVGLWTTAYGRALMVKLGLMGGMLALAAVHRWGVLPRLTSGPRWFAQTLLAEAVLGLGVLAVTGVLVSLPPARSELEARAGQVTITLANREGRVQLVLAPGVAGPNRYTATVGVAGAGEPTTQVLLRVAPRDLPTSEQEIALRPDGPGRFSAVGSQLSLAGSWRVTMIVRRPGMADWRAEGQVAIGTTPPPAPWVAPRPAWLVWLAGLGVALGGAGGVGWVLGRQTVRDHPRLRALWQHKVDAPQ